MTQLLDPSGPFACVWDETLDGCEIPEPQPLIVMHADGTSLSEQELLEFIFNNDFPPIEPIPLPAGGIMLLSALAMVAVLKRRA